MSGTESLSYGESKSPPVGETGHEHRLHRGALGIMDISAATMANIGPAMSFYYAILPGLGAIAIIVPLYYLAKPGQPTPYDWFPYAALIVVVVAASYAYILNSRDPGLAGRVGSIVADE